MKKLEPYPIALSLFFVFTFFYVVCIGIKVVLIQLGIEGIWQMHKIWQALLPGFAGIDSMSILIGLLEVSVGSYAMGYIIVPLYNLLIEKKAHNFKPEVKPVFVRFKTLFFTLLTYLFILFSLCFIYDLFIPEQLKMAYIWDVILPGFNDLSLTSYLIGLLDILIYSAYTSLIFSVTLNYFEKTQFSQDKSLEGEGL